MKIIFLSLLTVFSIQSIDKSLDKSLFDLVKFGDHIDLDKMDELIKKGANINAMNSNDISFIMLLTLHKKREAINRLIRLKINLNHPNSEGNTLLMLNPKMPAISWERSWERLAIYEIDPNIILLLIEAGADVNAQNNDLETPLIFAIYRKSLVLIKLFIKYGALIDHKNKEGKTAIDIAKIQNKDVFEFLKKTRSENVEKRKRKIKVEAGKYISTGSYGPLQYVLEYSDEYVPELENHEEEIWSV